MPRLRHHTFNFPGEIFAVSAKVNGAAVDENAGSPYLPVLPGTVFNGGMRYMFDDDVAPRSMSVWLSFQGFLEPDPASGAGGWTHISYFYVMLPEIRLRDHSMERPRAAIPVGAIVTVNDRNAQAVRTGQPGNPPPIDSYYRAQSSSDNIRFTRATPMDAATGGGEIDQTAFHWQDSLGSKAVIEGRLQMQLPIQQLGDLIDPGWEA